MDLTLPVHIGYDGAEMSPTSLCLLAHKFGRGAVFSDSPDLEVRLAPPEEQP
jgi:hypothetical protein